MKSSIVAALSTKAAAGGAVAALAVGGGAAAAAHVTGTNDPISWGQHIVQVVEGCKDSVRGSGAASASRESGAASASRGIGHCVSAVAQKHGEQQRAQHSEQGEGTASPSPLPGRREGQESPLPKGSGNSAGAADHGQSTSHPTPAASHSPGDHGPGDHGRPTPTP